MQIQIKREQKGFGENRWFDLIKKFTGDESNNGK